MAARGCGVLPPRFVKSCSIRNESNGGVQIQVTYRKIGQEPGNSPESQYAIGLSQGETHKVASRTVDNGGCQFNSPIQRIDVTLANGGQLYLEDPFDGVNKIEPDWLFAINDHGIKSLPPGN